MCGYLFFKFYEDIRGVLKKIVVFLQISYVNNITQNLLMIQIVFLRIFDLVKFFIAYHPYHHPGSTNNIG